MSSSLARRTSAGRNHPLGDWLPLFTSSREEAFSETRTSMFPRYKVGVCVAHALGVVLHRNHPTHYHDHTLLCGSMNTNHTLHGHRYTVNEAAGVLGISAEAVRARINRGTLPKEKDADGTVYVRMNVDHTHPNDRTDGHMNGSTDGDHTTDHTVSNDSVAFQIMQDQVAFLRAELERKDAILLTMAQRIPELDAAPEPRGDPVSPSEDSTIGESPEPARRSWWRRLLEM
jgi:hypothetical protein